MIARPQGEEAPSSSVYQGDGSVSLSSFLVQAEGIELAHVLVEVHPDLFESLALHPYLQVTEDDQGSRWPQTGYAGRDLGRFDVAADRGSADQHLRAVRLLGADAYLGLAVRRLFDQGAHLLALDDHVPVVSAQAAGLEPLLPPQVLEQGHELAEVGGTLDRTAGLEPHPLGGRIVVDGHVPAVLLLGEHLFRGPERSTDHCRRLESVGHSGLLVWEGRSLAPG